MMATSERTHVKRAAADAPWLRFSLNGLLVAFTAFFLARCLDMIAEGLRLRVSRPIHSRFVGPQYYFSYDHGFIRRGLPGALFELLGGPAHISVDAFGWGLVFGAVIAIALLAVMMFGELRTSSLRYAAAALVLLCPLSVSLSVVDAGRYDTIGI